MPQKPKTGFPWAAKWIIFADGKTEIKFRLFSGRILCHLKRILYSIWLLRALQKKEWQVIKNQDDEQLLSILGIFQIWFGVKYYREKNMEYTASGYRYLLHFRQKSKYFASAMNLLWNGASYDTKAYQCWKSHVWNPWKEVLDFCDKDVSRKVWLYSRARLTGNNKSMADSSSPDWRCGKYSKQLIFAA